MIDTVIISIPKQKLVMNDLDAYGVPMWDLQSRTRAYDKYVKNPSSSDRKSGLYFPRLTGYKRKNDRLEWEATVKMEFSVPKLIYRNNLDELQDGQFQEVILALQDRLMSMGIKANSEDLASAPVKTVHYSKNIKLLNGFTSQYVISELNKINLNKRFDLTRARYMNDGQSLYAYTQAHSLVIYDKVADLARSKKKAIDTDQPSEQLQLFKPLSNRKSPTEIIRFEVRLCQKQKINSLFKKLGYAPNPTFRDIFSEQKSLTVLEHYWRTLLNGNSALLFANTLTSKDLLKQILLVQQGIKPKEAIYRLGLIWVAREGHGLRELRACLTKRADDRTWYRVALDAKKTEESLSRLRPREWHNQIENAFKSYQPYRIVV